MGKLDKRTESYLKAVKESMGYIGTNHGWHTMEEILKKKGIEGGLKQVATYDGYMNTNDIIIYEYEKDGSARYCAELGYQTDIDDYNIETIIFTQRPSREDVITARAINDIECDLKLGRLKPEFRCWECGCESHWLDISGSNGEKLSLEERLNRWREKYCGC
jgi:hypothetical protein